MKIALQILVDAIGLGCLYALIALGIALIFGIMRLVNFAHGELIMASAFTFMLLRDTPWPLAILATLFTAVTLALLMERVAFRPVRYAAPTTLLVTSFAVSFLLQNVGILVFGAAAQSVSLPIFLSSYVSIGFLRLGVINLLIIGVTLLLIGALAIFFKISSLGIQMRAAAEDFRMARLLGVHADRVVAGAFAMSGVLGAVVALALVAQSGLVEPTMGQGPVLIGFVATVVGGLGSLPAAGLGGFVVGFISVALQSVLPVEFLPFRDAFVFGLVIVILLVRPQGLVVLRREILHV